LAVNFWSRYSIGGPDLGRDTTRIGPEEADGVLCEFEDLLNVRVAIQAVRATYLSAVDAERAVSCLEDIGFL